MTQDIIGITGDKMDKAVEVFKNDLGTIRAGRATPTLLDKVMVDYYGTATPLNQLATISAPEARLLVVQPWDKSIIGSVEKSILKSDLGLNPSNDGSIIRLPVPQLNEERRRELVKVVNKKGEEARVAVRNVRRDANEQLKSQEKKGEITQDDLRRSQQEVQQCTDEHIKEIDNLLAVKEKEILEV